MNPGGVLGNPCESLGNLWNHENPGDSWSTVGNPGVSGRGLVNPGGYLGILVNHLEALGIMGINRALGGAIAKAEKYSIWVNIGFSGNFQRF